MRRSSALIGPGAVDQLDVMQRHLARLHDQVLGLTFVDLDLDLLAAREQVVRGKGLGVRQHVPLVAARDHAHAAALGRARRERDPGGHDVGRLQPPIGEILMPGDVARVVRFLGEEAARPAQDVGSDHALDRIEHGVVAHQLVEPGEQQMGLLLHGALERPAVRRLGGFHLLSTGGRPLRAEHPDRAQVSLLVILPDLRVRQAHGPTSPLTSPDRLSTAALPMATPGPRRRSRSDVDARPALRTTPSREAPPLLDRPLTRYDFLVGNAGAACCDAHPTPGSPKGRDARHGRQRGPAFFASRRCARSGWAKRVAGCAPRG